MEDVLERRELTLESFKLLRKDYSRLKSRVKAIEKKLMPVIEQEGNGSFVSNWIGREVASIENKYKDIDHAIKYYNVAMKSFNDTIHSPYFINFNPQDKFNSPLYNLKSYLNAADMRITAAFHAIRITQRYFKNISSAFKGHATLMASKNKRSNLQGLTPLPTNQDETKRD